MTRTRISTTVDSALLDEARRTGAGKNDAELVDAALAALVAHYSRQRIDALYAAAYEDHPLSEADEWGDLETFRSAAGST